MKPRQNGYNGNVSVSFDVTVLWEPLESQAVMQGYAHFAKQLYYSKSKAVGADLGVVMASGGAPNDKREAIRRPIWAYIKVLRDITSLETTLRTGDRAIHRGSTPTSLNA